MLNKTYTKEGLWMIKILKICAWKFFIFVKFWKCARKYYEIRKHFLFLFYTLQREELTDKATIKSWNRRCLHIKPQLKVEIEDGCVASYKSSLLKNCILQKSDFLHYAKDIRWNDFANIMSMNNFAFLKAYISN